MSKTQYDAYAAAARGAFAPPVLPAVLGALAAPVRPAALDVHPAPPLSVPPVRWRR
jgi:hypothetical protein